MCESGRKATTILIGLELGQLVGSGSPFPSPDTLHELQSVGRLLSQAGLLYGARAAVTLNHTLGDLNNRMY